MYLTTLTMFEKQKTARWRGAKGIGGLFAGGMGGWDQLKNLGCLPGVYILWAHPPGCSSTSRFGRNTLIHENVEGLELMKHVKDRSYQPTYFPSSYSCEKAGLKADTFRLAGHLVIVSTPNEIDKSFLRPPIPTKPSLEYVRLNSPMILLPSKGGVPSVMSLAGNFVDVLRQVEAATTEQGIINFPSSRHRVRVGPYAGLGLCHIPSSAGRSFSAQRSQW